MRHEIGLTPKTIGRVLRFGAVVEQLRSGATDSLAEVAAVGGYYDQSHFARDVRRFAGTTPGELAASLLPDRGGFVATANDGWLSVPYAHPRAAIDWLGRAFGCELGFVVPPSGDEVRHSELFLADNVVMAEPLGRDPAAWGPGRQLTCVAVDAPDEHHARAVEAGATVVMPLANLSYGGRAYTARDPEGFLWTFCTYRPSGRRP